MILLTAKLKRYKEQVKVLKEGQKVDLKSKDNVLDSRGQSVEIDRLKQTLSEHLKEKESLMQTVTLLKNDFKIERIRKLLDREIGLEKKINSWDIIVLKDQSAQIVHMLMKTLEQGLTVTALKDELRKLKGKGLADNVVSKHTIDPKMLKIDEEDAILKEIVEKGKSPNPLNNSLDSIYKVKEKQFGKPKGKVFSNIGYQLGVTYWSGPSLCKPKIVKSISANNKEHSTSWGSISSDVPSSSLDECRLSKLFSVKFRNDHVAKILGYGDYYIRNVTILRVYYVEGLRHNLFSVGQFCDSNLEVAFRQHTCFIRNLEGVDSYRLDLSNNLYTLSLGDMLASSPICLLLKASKTKSWLWHRHLSHLNFGAINHLARHDLDRGLPKLKFEKDHMYSVCAMGQNAEETPQT
ncbi:retrovirus-related pol polyprotein from transposon TNT 1-94 [Tanacetum coccineum]